MNLATMARNNKKAIVEECDAGIAKVVVPIFVADSFVDEKIQGIVAGYQRNKQ
jgi:hypothetical protein